MYGYIYLTTNLINGHKYIGQHVSEKLDKSYLGSGALMLKAIAHYGRPAFKVEILETAESKEELNQLEIKHIQLHDAVNRSDYYNIEAGGCHNTGNYVWLTKNGIDKLVPSEEIDSFIVKGYQRGFSQGGVNKGKTVVTKDGVDKFIKVEDLKLYIDKGYLHGRHICPTQGKIIVNKDGKEVRIYKSELNEYLSNGYNKGRASSSSTLGRVKINKGGVEKSVPPDQLNEYISEGWVRGTLVKMPKVDSRGKIWITNGFERHFIFPHELEKYPGYRRGKKLTKEGSTTIESISEKKDISE